MRRVLAGLWLLSAAATAVATSIDEPPDVRLPCDGEPAWDPSVAMVLRWGWGTVPIDAPALRNGVRLTTETGEEVPLIFAQVESGLVALCPERGFVAGAAYVWEVDGFGRSRSNEPVVPWFEADGRWTFRVAEADAAPAADADACAARVPALPEWGDPCNPDTGDSGW
ncbi:MAG: hypothetical protein ACOZNI_13560 [Myxococcota bacterium]